jgi:outer membrane protein assembly factor BamB
VSILTGTLKRAFCCTLVLAGVTLAASACIRPGRTIANPGDAVWATRSGDPAHHPFIGEHVPADVHVGWEAGVGRGVPFAPIVQHDVIITVVSGGGIQTHSAVDGSRYWGRRFRGSIAGQPVRVNDRVFFATSHRSGTAYALDLSRGRRLWSRDLNGRAAADAVYADETVYVSTDRGEVYALHAASGAVRWRTRIYATAAQPPVVIGDELVIATTRDSLVRVVRQTGAVRAKLPLPATPSAPLAVAGDTLVIALVPGVLVAFAGIGEREIWRHELGAPILAAPVLTDSGVYALTRDAIVYRVQHDGVQRVAELGGTATESLTVTADGVIVGRLDGSVVFLRRDGTMVWEESVQGSVRAPVAVRDSSVFVATLAGRLVKLAP